MRISFSTIAAVSLLAIGVSAAPVADPKAIALASPEAQANAQAVANAIPAANAQAEAVAALGLDFSSVTTAITALNKDFKSLSTLFTNSTALPSTVLKDVVNVVIDFVEGVVAALGSVTSLSSITDTINNLLSQAISALDTITEVTGLTDSLNTLLVKVVDTVKTLLENIASTLISVVADLIQFNLVGVVTSVLGGALTILTTVVNAL